MLLIVENLGYFHLKSLEKMRLENVFGDGYGNERLIKSFFCSLKIILYIILFCQVNQISFLVALNPNHF